jgi:L-threonylcarbamoyladenylate synthase
MIVLISSLEQLKRFDIKLNSKQEKFLKKIWPEKVSVVLDCLNEKMKHLHRGKKTIAFRFPKEKWLLDVLKKTGPLVAPSANLSGEKPSEDINQAKAFFGEKIEFYVDAGKIKSRPSTIIRLFGDGKFEILRQGDIKVKI